MEIYREHEKFRKHLEQIKDEEPAKEEPSNKSPFKDLDGAAASSAPDKGEEEVVDDGFLQLD